MYSKIIYIIFFLALTTVCAEKKFTIVLDTTVSMKEELDIIKVKLGSAVNELHSAGVTNYIIVPFKDPGLLEPIIVDSPQNLIAELNRFTARGGQECPENSLEGIEKALQISGQDSTIFVFTDAYPKDGYKLPSIQDLCRQTRSQVMIILSGFCSSGTADAYYEVAKSCAGAVLRFESGTLRQAFNTIKHVAEVQWTEITTFDTFDRHKELLFSVDLFTKNVMVLISGEYPNVEITAPDGSRPNVEIISDNRHTQVIRIVDYINGEYKMNLNARGKTTVTMYKKYQLPINFGFSTAIPRSLRETSTRPLPDRMNYIFIDVSQTEMTLDSVEIQRTGENSRTVLALEENRESKFYLAKTYVDEKSFRIWVRGHRSTESFKEITGFSETILPQVNMGSDDRWIAPTSEILEADSISVEYLSKLTLVCKVLGYPKPNVNWKDDMGNSLPSEDILLEIPSTYLSYVTIDSVTTQKTITCKSVNSEGQDSKSIDLNVIRPYTFDVIQTPSDQTIEFGSEAKLYCEVSAYPDAEIKWYHNDTLISSFDDVKLLPEENALYIENMTLDNVGEYKCKISNEANEKEFTATVTISGIELPEIEAVQTNVLLSLGDWTNLECRLKSGKPSPAITWMFKSDRSSEFGPIQDTVLAEEGKLKIASAQRDHKGTYKCEASNFLGTCSAEITVNLQYPPVITAESTNTVTVKEGDDVSLPCDVQGEPSPQVRWEMTQDDVIVTFDGRHVTNEDHTHRFNALWRDSGNYHCIAENDVGRAEKTITVNVLVAPYIEPPTSTIMNLRSGDSATLNCNVLYGNPTPTTRWEFMALDSTVTILSRSNSSSALRLTKISRAQEGTYLCLTQNSVNTDSIKIYVKVH